MEAKEKLTGNVRKLREYIPADKVKHVTYKADANRQVHICGVCGHLPVIDGVVIHTKPDEDHDWQ